MRAAKSTVSTTTKRRPHQKVKTGCVTCRLRRVKCDEGKPSCTRCIKADFVCKGYKDVRETWLFEPVKTSTNFTSRRKQSNARARQFSDSEVSPKQRLKSVRLVTTPECFSKWNIVYRDVLFSKFADRWFAFCCPVAVVPEKTTLSRWAATGITSTFHDDDGCQNDAFVFLSLCTLIAKTKDKRFQQHARVLYGTLLPRIRQGVARLMEASPSQLRNNLIRSCLACAMGEYLIDSFENYERHLEGIALIVQNLNPDEPLDDESQRLILDHAAIWIGCNILRRRMPKTYPVSRLQHCFKFNAVGSMQEVCINAYDCLPLFERYKLEGLDYDKNQLATIYEDFNEQWAKLDAWRSERLDIDRNIVMPCTEDDMRLILTNGYCCGYMIHLAQHMLEVAQRLKEKNNVTENKSRLRSHAKSVITGIEDVLELEVGLSSITCLLFPLESSWMALQAVGDLGPQTISRFRVITMAMAERGVRPIREPWAAKGITPQSPSARISHSLRHV